ncbi:hypothetical protein E2C01_091680 [Portunus trituberculatus]|uniref:Uncharacterized protein n=1 Tax=Portunus trituberculatus TaxID=210409 RepID=A0A5B7JJN4_PORTR|nr:hypothetical protein [Portunus trituberculatus]
MSPHVPSVMMGYWLLLGVGIEWSTCGGLMEPPMLVRALLHQLTL